MQIVRKMTYGGQLCKVFLGMFVLFLSQRNLCYFLDVGLSINIEFHSVVTNKKVILDCLCLIKKIVSLFLSLYLKVLSNYALTCGGTMQPVYCVNLCTREFIPETLIFALPSAQNGYRVNYSSASLQTSRYTSILFH